MTFCSQEPGYKFFAGPIVALQVGISLVKNKKKDPVSRVDADVLDLGPSSRDAGGEEQPHHSKRSKAGQESEEKLIPRGKLE